MKFLIPICVFQVGWGSVSTVVSLYTHNAQPAHIDWSDRTSLYPIRIKDQPFVCVVDEESDAVRLQRAAQLQLKAQWAPLAGYTWDEPELHIEFNRRIETPVGTFELSQKSPDPNALWYVEEGEEEHVALVMKDAKLFFDAKKICRPGDSVDGGTPVLQTFANGTAKIERDGKPAWVSLASLGCDSDGVVRVADLVYRGGGEGSIDFFSNLFLDPAIEDTPTLLAPLTNTCLMAQLFNHLFEYCFPGRFRFIQIRGPANHPVAVEGSGEVTWGGKRGSVVSDLSVERAAAFLSEQLQVFVGGTSFSGVGGSFNPVGSDRVFAGTLFTDPEHPSGCSAEAFAGAPTDAPWIAVVDRGECMFQEKGLVAQKKGAAGVVVVNIKSRGMIAAMASLPGKPALEIPMVLVRVKAGRLMKAHLGEFGTIKPYMEKSVKKSTKVEFSLNFVCDPEWEHSDNFAAPCQVGDKVLLQKEGEPVASQGVISEVLNHGLYVVAGEQFLGTQLFRDSQTPCTAQLGTFIDEVTVEGSRVSLQIHSALLCRSPRFRDPPVVNSNVVCAMDK